MTIQPPRPLRLLLRLVAFPWVLVAVAAAAMLLAGATAAGPAFLSSASDAALRRSVAGDRASIPAFSLFAYGPIEADVLDYRDELLVQALRGTGLGSPIRSAAGTQFQVSRPGQPSEVGVPSIPLTRTEALRHIEVVRRGSGEGVWVPEGIARQLKAGPGDRLVVSTAGGRATVRVAGIYRDIGLLPRQAYWEPLAGLLYLTGQVEVLDAPPPPQPLLFADRRSFDAVVGPLHGQAQFGWEFRFEARDLDLVQAERSAARVSRVQTELGDPQDRLGAAFPGASFDSPLPAWIEEGRSTVEGITGPVDTLSLAARLAAIVVVAGAGVYGVHRRRVEFDLLNARGVGPVPLALRSAAEAAVPVTAGAAVGWALALALAGRIGPGTGLDRAVAASSARDVAWTVAAAVALLGVASALAARSRAEARAGRVRQVAARVPWEGGVLALAAASYYEIHTRGGGLATAPGEAPHVDRLLLLFPVLFVGGLAGVAIRGLRRALPRLRSSRVRSISTYLAIRRLAAAPAIALMLVTASTLATGILAYGGVLSASTSTTARVKALVSTGSDVSVRMGGRASPVPGVASTPITRVSGVAVLPSEEPAELLGIDPKTFATAAYWNDGVMGTPVDEVVRELSVASSGDLRVVVVGGSLPPHSRLTQSGVSVPVRQVGSARAFPGMHGRGLLLVAATDAIDRAAERASLSLRSSFELWGRGDPDRILPVLARHRVPIDAATTAERSLSTPAFLVLSWSLGFLQALGVVAGLVALIGVLLYLQARQRSREVSYALARRMGLSRATHRMSVSAELAGMLLFALAAGAALASVAAALVYARLDPLPSLPPSPLFRLPGVLFGAALAVVAAASLGGAWAVQRRADRANVAEVMRLAG